MFSTIVNKTPWILVVSSMTLLFLFIGYWNVSTYLREKQKLSEDVEIQLQLAFTEIKDSELVYFIKTHLKKDMEGSEVYDSISIFFDEAPVFPTTIDFQSKYVNDRNQSDLAQDTTVFFGIELDTNLITNLNREESGTEVTIVATSNINSFLRSEQDFPNDSGFNDKIIERLSIQRNPKISKGGFEVLQDSSNVKTWEFRSDSAITRLDSLGRHNHTDFLNPLRFFSGSKSGSLTSVDKTYALF